MAKLTLYHAAPSRSSIVRWMLEEIGEPYDVHLLSLGNGDNRKPDYLAINPMGKVLISPTNSHAPSSTCRSAIRAAVLISNGCSSARAASRPR
jgi:hypothetical protein